MCGRFTLKTPTARIAELFAVMITDLWQPRYNIAPTQWIPAIRCMGEIRELSLLHWGLIPSWSKDSKAAAGMINARSETVAGKPAFRSAFRRRRCLIPADGFYEWLKLDAKTKVPHLFQMQDESPFGFGGLWEEWTSPDGEIISSCTILTTSANELVAPVHDRMPVILPQSVFSVWLNPTLQDPDLLQTLLCPFPASQMKSTPVSSIINNARNNVDPQTWPNP
jgi:putative SOS response-associated peptidase YedK